MGKDPSPTQEESWADLFKLAVNLLKRQINQTSGQGFFVKSFILGLLVSSAVGIIVKPKLFMPPFDMPAESVNNNWMVGVLIIIGTLNFIYLVLNAEGNKWQRLNKTIAGGAGMSMGLTGGIYVLIPMFLALIIVAIFAGLYKIISINTRHSRLPEKQTKEGGKL